MPLEPLINGPSESGETARAKLNAWLDQINTNVTDISQLQSDVNTNTGDITSLISSVASNTADISDNTNNIAINTANIATNTANIATNASNTATNTSNIATNTANIAANTSAISGKQDKNAVSTLIFRIVNNANNFTFSTANDFFVHTNAAGTTLTVPDDTTAPNFLVGGVVEVYNSVTSTNPINVAVAGAVTLQNANSTTNSISVGDSCRFIKTASNRWVQLGA